MATLKRRVRAARSIPSPTLLPCNQRQGAPPPPQPPPPARQSPRTRSPRRLRRVTRRGTRTHGGEGLRRGLRLWSTVAKRRAARLGPAGRPQDPTDCAPGPVPIVDQTTRRRASGVAVTPPPRALAQRDGTQPQLSSSGAARPRPIRPLAGADGHGGGDRPSRRRVHLVFVDEGAGMPAAVLSTASRRRVLAEAHPPVRAGSCLYSNTSAPHRLVPRFWRGLGSREGRWWRFW